MDLSVLGAVLLVVALLLGIAAGVLRKRASLPAALRYTPVVLALALMAIPLAYVVLATMSMTSVDEADAANKAALFAQGISELMNAIVLTGIIAFTFATGLIPTLILLSRRRPPRPTATS